MKLFFLFLIAQTVVACNNGKAEQQKKDMAKLSNFPGTSIYIQLPEGFAWNETAMGFYKEEDGSEIKYDEFKKMRYAANMPVETVGSLTKQETVTISGYKGEIKTYQDGRTFTRLGLSFGDSTFVEFIEATYFSHREETGKDILAAFETLVYKK